MTPYSATTQQANPAGHAGLLGVRLSGWRATRDLEAGHETAVSSSPTGTRANGFTRNGFTGHAASVNAAVDDMRAVLLAGRDRIAKMAGAASIATDRSADALMDDLMGDLSYSDPRSRAAAVQAAPRVDKPLANFISWDVKSRPAITPVVTVQEPTVQSPSARMMESPLLNQQHGGLRSRLAAFRQNQADDTLDPLLGDLADDRRNLSLG